MYIFRNSFLYLEIHLYTQKFIYVLINLCTTVLVMMVWSEREQQEEEMMLNIIGQDAPEQPQNEDVLNREADSFLNMAGDGQEHSEEQPIAQESNNVQQEGA